MKPKLPKILLWQDLELSEIKSELLFDELNEVFDDIVNSGLGKKPSRRVVFNELYYQCTRLIYEDDPEPDLGMLDLDVMADVGTTRTAEIVFKLIFCLFTARMENSKNIEKTALGIFSYYGMNSEPSEKFSNFIQKHQKGIKHYMALPPRPIKVSMLEYQGLFWDKITCNYNPQAIEEIAKLWPEKEDRIDVLYNIEMAYKSYKDETNSSDDSDKDQSSSSANEPDFDVLRIRVRDYDSSMRAAEPDIQRPPTLFEQLKEKEEEIKTLKNANLDLRSKIEQIRSNNNESKSESNRERSFTFARIVEYCYTLPREERLQIIGMLSVFLRDDCNITTEEKNILNDLNRYRTGARPDIVFGNKNVFDGSSQQVAVNSKGQLDIEALIKLLSPEMREQIIEAIDNNG